MPKMPEVQRRHRLARLHCLGSGKVSQHRTRDLVASVSAHAGKSVLGEDIEQREHVVALVRADHVERGAQHVRQLVGVLREPNALLDAVSRPLTLDDIGPGSPAARSPGVVGLEQFVNRAPALWHSDRPGRDAQTPATSGLNAIAPVSEWENPPEDSDVSRGGLTRVGMEDVAYIQAARDRYEYMYRRVGGVATRVLPGAAARGGQW